MKKKTIVINPTRARTLFLTKQLLAKTEPLSGKTGTFRIIDALGYVQIDTISVIERSHHIVLFNRCPDYRQSFLDELLAQDRKIFEYWAHMASYIPMRDYRYYLRKMKRPPQEGSWIDNWLKGNQRMVKKVRRRIEKEGPLSARDFSDVRNRKRGPWWDWKPAKMALEVLFWRGELMIKERRNFQRVYDLTERVLPPGVNTTLPGEVEEKIFFMKRALHALGIATQQDMQNYIKIRVSLGSLIDETLSSGEICAVSVKGISKPFYVHANDLEFLQGKQMRGRNKVYFLSPFDNTIIMRERTKALFGFDYALESYKPKKQRIFGYFCLPILWKNDIIGRIDLKADRKKSTLIIRNLHIEKENVVLEKFLPQFMTALTTFARFHNAIMVVCENVFPSKFKTEIRRCLQKGQIR